MKSSSTRRECPSLEGYIQPLHSYSGLSKLREDKSGKDWFVAQDCNLHLYDRKGSKILPDSKPSGSIDFSTASLDVFVVITSNGGKDFQLCPPRDVCVFDWLVTLKELTKLAREQNVTSSSFERGAGAGTIMGKLRSSFRRKKRVTRTMSENSNAGTNLNSPVTGLVRSSPQKEPLPRQEPKHSTVSRSKSFPLETTEDEECSQSLPLKKPERNPAPSQIEEGVSLESSCDFGVVDNGEAQSVLTEDSVKEDTQEEIKRPPVETKSVEVQTDAITNSELMSLQQQKI
ncbi:PREDICTED: uncharacterized protein LOC107334282 [Acropora digitifera]|uniref:uncharacterized protein LOC107334282 n=1 Tax=Acropora digitifera TaxID=70779 RepID=UPI00077AD585|nr:PREDICTED: uncharacterized protein LOC107334282 [Acropora digitifera]